MRLSVEVWMWMTVDVPNIIHKLKTREEGLATTEWALLVAGVAALAIAVVATVRSQTNEATSKIQTNVHTGTGILP